MFCVSGILCSRACSKCAALCLVSSTGDQRRDFSQLTVQDLRDCRIWGSLRRGVTLDHSAAPPGLHDIVRDIVFVECATQRAL